MSIIKLLEDIDDYLAYLEDFTHGEEGTKITHLRVRIEDSLKESIYTKEQVKDLLLELSSFKGNQDDFKEVNNWIKEKLK